MEFSIPHKIQHFQAEVRIFVKRELEPVSYQVEEDDDIPEDVLQKMKNMRFFGLAIPERYGDLGLTTLGEIAVYEELT